MNDFIAAVQQHSLENYENDGWDYVVECYDDTEIADVIKTARASARLISGSQRSVRPYASGRIGARIVPIH